MYKLLFFIFSIQLSNCCERNVIKTIGSYYLRHGFKYIIQQRRFDVYGVRTAKREVAAQQKRGINQKKY